MAVSLKAYPDEMRIEPATDYPTLEDCESCPSRLRTIVKLAVVVAASLGVIGYVLGRRSRRSA